MRYPIIIILLGIILSTAGCGPEKKKHFHYFRNYSRTFNDLNDRHMRAARKWGIEPVGSVEELRRLKGRVEEVKSCRLYAVDKLTHSHPFLVPRAGSLLRKIGQNFRDSLAAKGLPAYRIIVTSVLRTDRSVKKLRKRNLNASANSAHRFATTFDIAYARFEKAAFRKAETDKLKSVLAEVLRDLRKEKKCYVRYEYKQGCFHITAR